MAQEKKMESSPPQQLQQQGTPIQELCDNIYYSIINAYYESDYYWYRLKTYVSDKLNL